MEERFKKILAISLELNTEDVNNEISFDNVINWDSLKQMNIIVALEEEFGIGFEEAESILLNNYNSLFDAVQEKVAVTE